MGALYGILGDSDAGEITSIGERLAHRGGRVAEWSLTPTLRLGMHSPGGRLERLAGGPIVFDGAIDNRAELSSPPADRLHCSACSSTHTQQAHTILRIACHRRENS